MVAPVRGYRRNFLVQAAVPQLDEPGDFRKHPVKRGKSFGLLLEEFPKPVLSTASEALL
jgi:hypothetical protein